MTYDSLDFKVRQAAFDWLGVQRDIHGDVLPSSVLRQGFPFGDEHIKLMGPQGIFKPRILPEIPLSITTAPPKPGKQAPYEDRIGRDGIIEYKYRGEDPRHHENVGLREALKRKTPLIYFYGLSPGNYVAEWPVFVVGDDPASLTFKVQVDDPGVLSEPAEAHVGEGAFERRRYITTTFQRRLHQRSFRERVMRAYRKSCAVCRLRHEELLDAAHIIEDKHPSGQPIVTNGLALCKLHHAAFDSCVLGIRPDYSIEVRTDVLKEKDGPMLVHGIQDCHGREIVKPRHREEWPDPERLAERYDRFRRYRVG